MIHSLKIPKVKTQNLHDSEEVENDEDDIVTNSVSASDKSDTEGNIDGNVDDLNDKVWICENCKSLPSEIHKLKQSNMNIEKELKSIKDILRTYIKALQTKTRLYIKLSSRIIKGQALKLPPPNLLHVSVHINTIQTMATKVTSNT